MNDLVSALQVQVPSLTKEEAQAAVSAVLGLLGGLEPVGDSRIAHDNGCWIHAAASGEIVGKINDNVGVFAGRPEGDWTPILFFGWVGSGMLG